MCDTGQGKNPEIGKPGQEFPTENCWKVLCKERHEAMWFL